MVKVTLETTNCPLAATPAAIILLNVNHFVNIPLAVNGVQCSSSGLCRELYFFS